MTGRPRGPEGGAPGGHSGAPRPRAAGTMAEAQQNAGQAFRAGRAGTATNLNTAAGGNASTADDVALAQIIRRHEQLGDEPPEFNIQRNDDAHQSSGAHTIDRHGPDIPLRSRPDTKTIEGRIHGDTGWGKAATASYQWTDPSTMNREINAYVQRNWPAIRDDLAFDKSHESTFDAGHRVGQGFYNKGMFGAGPREAEYGETSLVRIRIKLVEGSDPAQPFVVTAFPAGLG